MIKRIWLFYIGLSILVTSLQAQQPSGRRVFLDTLQSGTIADTLKSSKQALNTKDSVVFNNRFRANYYFNDFNSGQSIAHSEIIKSDHLSFSDLLKRLPGYFAADYGSPGMYNPVFYQGLPSTNTSVLVDGIPFGNSFLGSFEQGFIMLEDIERVEIVSPVQSIAYGNINIINIVTDKKNFKKPHTYVRHSEAAYETYLTDVLFTGNITSTSNIYVGFNYHLSEGRFSNSDYSYFGGRIRYRKVFSDKIELNISDYFSKLDRGIHGGVKLTSKEVTEDIFDERAVSVLFPAAKQNYLKNIITAQAAGYFFNDSLQSSLLTISFNTEENIFKDIRHVNDSVIKSINIPLKTNMLSITARQNIFFDNQLLSFYLSSSFQNTGDFSFFNNAFDTLYYNSNNGDKKIFFSLIDKISFSELFGLNLSGKYLIWDNKHESETFTSKLSVGVNPFLKVNNFIFSTGFVWGNRELFPFEVFYPLQHNEHLYLNMSKSKKFNKLFADFSFQSAFYGLKLTMFRSFIDKQTLFEFNNTGFPVSTTEFDFLYDIENRGLSIDANMRLGKIEFESNINYNYYTNSFIRKITPELFCYFGLYFESKLISDNINLKFGFNGNYYSQFFISPDIANLQNENFQKINYSPDGIINFLAALTIQSATIYISVNNLFNSNYFITKIYPMNDRNFMLSISWAFLD